MSHENNMELILENGRRFEGRLFGHLSESVGEVVFTTGMTGYQETLTDPSFAGQIVVMTYPLMGNYGTNLYDMESDSPKLNGFIVREKCDMPNNWRTEMTLEGFLKQHKITGIYGIDTRSLTRVLRDNGTLKGIIVQKSKNLTQEQIEEKFAQFSNKGVVAKVTTKEKYEIDGDGLHLAVMDFGIKRGILKSLSKRGCKLTVFPAHASVEEILSVNPDGIFLSNGPGDPKDSPEIIENVKELINKKPVVGICLGHQLIALSLGGSTKRLKFGHHGANHPVKHLDTGRVYITSQNHEFVISDMPEEVEAFFINVNDKSIEGIRHKTKPVASVQFHPEATPGPLDTGFLFDDFLKLIEEHKN